MSRVVFGLPASPGIVVGPAYLLRWEVPDVRQRIIPDEDIRSEIERFDAATATAKDRLIQLRDRAAANAGPDEAAIFDVQITILEDTELLGNVRDLIRQNLGAEKAFDLVMIDWRQSFSRHTNAMLRERVSDLTDVHIRVLSLLMNLGDHDPVNLPPGARAILVTHDLTPSLTLQLDRNAIIAIATDAGTQTSHVAILARSLGLPAVVGLREVTTKIRTGERVILNGSTGVLIVNPTDAQVDHYQLRAVEEAAYDAQLQAAAGQTAVSRDNVTVTIRANVDIPEEAEFAANSGAEGVGLMRTEFLVVGRPTMPDEEEQYRAYKRVVDAFHGRTVIIRTFDIGGDKLPIGGYPAEPNPFLGWRAIRMCLDEPELFKTQLAALMRAGVHGDVRVMLPLVVTVDEVRQAKQLLAEAAADLVEREIPHRADIPFGVMIETPAAAVSVDTFVDDVEFLSIGTNDLVQYTLAVDRGNANLAARFTPLHPAVLRLIQQTVREGEARNLEVCVCGEMASQPLMAFALIGLGVRYLSVSPRAVPTIKRLVRSMQVSVAQEAVALALRTRTAPEADTALRHAIATSLGDDTSFLRYGLVVPATEDTGEEPDVDVPAPIA